MSSYVLQLLPIVKLKLLVDEEDTIITTTIKPMTDNNIEKEILSKSSSSASLMGIVGKK